jgi:DNA-binding beta-propeller fold protein YncE
MTSPEITIDTLPKKAPGAEPAPEPGPAAPPPAVPDEEDDRRRRKYLLLLLLGLLLLVFIAFTIWYLLFRKPVSEIIPPTDNFAMPAFVNAAYDVNQPLGVAVSPDGSRIYVAQGSGTQETLVLDSQGKKVGTLAAPAAEGARAAQMFVAVDPGTGDVYATDRTAGQVRIFGADGTFKRLLEPPAEMGAWQPMAIVVDKDGNVFVADVAPPFSRVHKFTRDGAFVRDYGKQGELNHPNGVALDSKGNVYVSNTGGGTLLVYGPDGEKRAAIARGPGAGDLGLPRGVAIDDKDRVYVVDSTGQRIQVYRALKDGAASLEFVDKFGTEGTTDGAFAFPNGVATDTRSRIYIADWNNDRIQIWSY